MIVSVKGHSGDPTSQNYYCQIDVRRLDDVTQSFEFIDSMLINRSSGSNKVFKPVSIFMNDDYIVFILSTEDNEMYLVEMMFW